MRIDNLYLVGKLFENVSPDSVQFSNFGCPVLCGQETHMPSPVEPKLQVQTKFLFFKITNLSTSNFSKSPPFFDWYYLQTKKRWEFLKIFMAFSEYMNFKNITNLSTRHRHVVK